MEDSFITYCRNREAEGGCSWKGTTASSSPALLRMSRWRSSGGLGSDTFNVGGSNGEPVIVVSNSLEGNSGLIDQSIFAAADDYRNVFLRDLSGKGC